MTAVQRVADAASALSLAYGHLDGRELVRAMATEVFPGRIAVISSFGAEAAVLLDLVAQVDPGIPVIFLDTDALFDETLEYRASLTAHLGLTDVRIIRPDPDDLKAADELWRTDADACCRMRKVVPLDKACAPFEALIDGRKRFHGAERAVLSSIEPGPHGKVKISPLARWSEQRIEEAFRERDLPRHPLVAQGFRSIGCWPCSRATRPGEPVRAGRWAGAGKTECGIHVVAAR